MKTFLTKTVILCVPLVCWLSVVALIDPFNLFKTSVVASDDKKDISYRLNYALWKYIEFEQSPTDRILLGDSRTNALSTSLIHESCGRDFYNFSFGGGGLPEIIETFWFAEKQTDLKEVVIGLNFDRYNGRENKNRCIEANNIVNNKLLYFVNHSVIDSCFYLVEDYFSDTDVVIGKPKMDRDTFWRHQLDKAVKDTYLGYLYPIKFYQELKEIAVHCETNDIALTFLILPIHVESQEQVNEFGLDAELAKFKKDLYSLGVVYDFHRSSRLTSNSELYHDPWHCKPVVANEVVSIVFSGGADTAPVDEPVVRISSMTSASKNTLQ